MSGVSGRRDPSQRLASGVGRRSPVGGGPGAWRVRRDGGGDQAEQAAAGALQYYGQLRVAVGALVGDSVGSSTVILFAGTPTDSLQNGATGSYSAVDGKFTPGAEGYWGLWVDFTVGSVTSTDFGYLEIEASSTGNIRIPFFNTGTQLRAAIQAGPFVTNSGDFFRVTAHVDSTFSGVVSGGQAVMWPTGLY